MYVLLHTDIEWGGEGEKTHERFLYLARLT